MKEAKKTRGAKILAMREKIELDPEALVTIYRREEGGWKRVLRHADRIPVA